jgi:hypothetical protein
MSGRRSGAVRREDFMIALVLMVCAGASELTMAQCSSYFAEKGLGVDKLLGDLLGPCSSPCSWARGARLRLSRSSASAQGSMLACAALCVACYAVTVLSRFRSSPCWAAPSAVSVSLMWPGPSA